MKPLLPIGQEIIADGCLWQVTGHKPDGSAEVLQFIGPAGARQAKAPGVARATKTPRAPAKAKPRRFRLKIVHADQTPVPTPPMPLAGRLWALAVIVLIVAGIFALAQRSANERYNWSMRVGKAVMEHR